MVRSKGSESGITAQPGTAEFRQQAYEAAKKQFLSESEVRELQEEKKMLQDSVRETSEAGAGSSRAGSVDTMKMQQKIKHIENTLQARTVEPARGRAKDKLYSEERELEDKLTIGMPSHYEMDRPAKNPGAVDKHLKWLKRNDENIKRWAAIQNQKGPDEEKRYLDSLRREK